MEEETTLKVQVVRFYQGNGPVFVTNEFYPDTNKHYVTLWFKATVLPDSPLQPINTEPHLCEGWRFLTLEQLRDEMPKEAVEASLTGEPHPALDWIPLWLLHYHRNSLGL